MANCECGQPVFIKKTAECKRCYHRRYARQHPLTEAQKDAHNQRRRERVAESRRLAALVRDERPFHVVLREVAEAEFKRRERHLEKRRAWNAAHAAQRAAYRRLVPDKRTHTEKTAWMRRAKLAGKAFLTRPLSDAQRERKNAAMRVWHSENRDRNRELRVAKERRVHFAGSPMARTGYAFAPCGARLHATDSTDPDSVTCRNCQRWLASHSPTN